MTSEASDVTPARQRIINLFEAHGLEAPPWRLRDKLVMHLTAYEEKSTLTAALAEHASLAAEKERADALSELLDEAHRQLDVARADLAGALSVAEPWHNAYEAAQSRADALEAHSATLQAQLDAVRQGEPVAIKSLEWDIHPDGDEWYSTDDPTGNGLGLYWVRQIEGFKKEWCLAVAARLIGNFDTPDEAKAAAQADYEDRIRSALVTAPPSEQVTALVEALRPFAEGAIDISGAAVILGYPETRAAIDRARAALSPFDPAKGDGK